MWPLKYIILATVTCVVGGLFLLNQILSSPEDTSNEITFDKNNIGSVQDNRVPRAEDDKILTLTDDVPEVSDNQSSPIETDASNQDQNTSVQADSLDLLEVEGGTENRTDYIDSIIAFLSDPYIDEAEKIQAAKNWIKPETREEILSLVQLMINSHEIGQNDLKDQLLQVLAGVDSNEPTEALISIIKGEMPEITFEELPEDLKYAIQKAIKLNPDTEWTGQVLAESSGYQSSEETIENLRAVNHPTMLYHLAQEADQRGEIEKVGQIVSSLISIENPESLEAIISLSKINVISVDDASLAAFDWAESHQNYLKQDQYESYLSEPNADSVVRSIAAYTLAASNDPGSALTSLKKAYDNETDKNTRYFYEEAINSLSQRLEVPNK